MAKNQHTFAKRQREMEKKRKAEEKRNRRRNKGKEDADATDESVDGIDNAAAAQSTQEDSNAALGTPEQPLSINRQT
jgi:hypothetical protein